MLGIKTRGQKCQAMVAGAMLNKCHSWQAILRDIKALAKNIWARDHLYLWDKRVTLHPPFIHNASIPAPPLAWVELSSRLGKADN